MYVTEQPCHGCIRAIAGTPIMRVITPTKEK